MRLRMVLIAGGVMSIFSLLSWRLTYLQMDRHEFYAAEAQRKHTTRVELAAHRGTLYDCRGQVLAEDVPVQQVAFDTGFLRYSGALAEALAQSEGDKTTAKEILQAWDRNEIRLRYVQRMASLLDPFIDDSAAEIEKKLLPSIREDKPSGEIILQREVPVNTGIAIREAIIKSELGRYRERLERAGAVVLRAAYTRKYPQGTDVGWFTGRHGYKDDKHDTKPSGINGAEKQFDKELSGKPGFRAIEVDGSANEVPFYRGEFEDSVDGKNLRTTIDPGLVNVLQSVLEEKTPADGGTSAYDMHCRQVIAVFFEPRTMALRAVVRKDFTGQDKGDPFINYALQFLYEPGSIIKLATIATGLSKNAVTTTTPFTIGQTRSWVDPNRQVATIYDAHTDADGEATVEDIFVDSSNIGSFFVARRVGKDAFFNAFKEFGFWQKSGIELPAERYGNFPARMSLSDMSRVAYGYKVMATPAQMCAVLGAILNDGIYRPLAVRDSWTDARGHVLEQVEQDPGRRVATAAACAALKKMMLKVVESGTGKPARSNLFEISGKTGTANKVDAVINPKTGLPRLDAKGRKILSYNPQKQNCSFLGYLSSHDGPELAGIVIVDEPQLAAEMRYGGKTAGPIFKRMAEAAMNYYRVAPMFAASEKTPVKK